ncbi:MAG: homoserine O-succinyltransferase [Paludibacteraceae bacterium]|nr:homoserine O-succinyltransferase [Paludibacteraceae bacterium]
MPLNIPSNLPAVEALKKENIFVKDSESASSQDIRPLKIIILNLMPLKITTETDLIRLLSNTPLQIEMDLLKVKSHTSKNTPIEHMMTFYKDFETIKKQRYDGMIITGAPVEDLNYEQVTYWDEIVEIFDWAKTHVTSTLFICWAAMAGLYHYYGIPKYALSKKKFGVFKHKILDGKNPIFRGFDDIFYAPHSRHSEIRRADIEKIQGLKIIAESDDAGVYIVQGRNGREFFITGHSEYAPNTLRDEYFRDKDKGLEIEIPCNYFEDDDPNKKPIVRWRSHGNLLFTNWLNYFVYQKTPYNISRIR